MQFDTLFKRLFGSSNDRRLKPMMARVERINALEPEIAALSDEALKGQTDKLKAKLSDGAKLDDILEEAFATAREAAKRALGQRHYDVQLLGGMVLHQGSRALIRSTRAIIGLSRRSFDEPK
ncbi:MAG: hypothetical protein AAGL49_15590, partial [Pseudomonadota bacterium]